MTSNMDEFDQDQFDASEPQEETSARKGGAKNGLVEAWQNKPLFKLLVIMAGVGGALALALGTFSSEKAPVVTAISQPPSMKELPGGPVSPFFQEQLNQANTQSAKEALAGGGSSFPVVSGRDVGDLTKPAKDPLTDFRDESERLKKELRSQQEQTNQKLEMMQQRMVQQQPRQAAQEDENLARAMQKQMQQLMDSWSPTGAKVVKGYAPDEDKKEVSKSAEVDRQASDLMQQANAQQVDPDDTKVIVPSGTVNYLQLLTEANSDIPGPILAQILSGPLAGGRAIGRFEVKNEYLVMSFEMVSLKGKEYSINAIALDPDTTLGGLATEVDHRYLTRILLPAAASFVSEFGQALGQTQTSTTVSDGTVLQDQAKIGSKEALYKGLGKVGDTMSQFFQNEANNTKTLVRVAVGTPMGLFFLNPVMKSGRAIEQKNSASSSWGPPRQGYEGNSQQQSVPYSRNNNQDSSAYGSGLTESQSLMLRNMMIANPSGSVR